MELIVSDDDSTVGYLYLGGEGISTRAQKNARSVRLRSLIPEYKGADVIIDFDKNNILTGIEILE